MKSTHESKIVIKNNLEIEDIFMNESGLRVCMCIYNKYKTIEMIAYDTKLPSLKIKFLINKFMTINIIEVNEKLNASGVVEKYYKVLPQRIKLVNDEDSFDAIAATSFFSEEIGRVMCSIGTNNGAGYARITSIKTKTEDAAEFIKEIEALVERYSTIENSESDDVYSFVSVLGLSR